MLAVRKYSCLAANTVFRLQVLKEVAKALIRHFVVVVVSGSLLFLSLCCPSHPSLLLCKCQYHHSLCDESSAHSVPSRPCVRVSPHCCWILAMHYCLSPMGACSSSWTIVQVGCESHFAALVEFSPSPFIRLFIRLVWRWVVSVEVDYWLASRFQEVGVGETILDAARCHHQDDCSIKMGSIESHCTVSLVVMGRVSRQCPVSIWRMKINHNFWTERRAKVIHLQAYNALLLGQTGSQPSPFIIIDGSQLSPFII